MMRKVGFLLISSIVAAALIVGGLLYLTRSRVPEGTLPEQIDWIMQREYDSNRLSGTVLVARGAEVLYERGFGMADIAKQVPNSPDTKFPIASLSKPFTAVLVMQLVESGELKLETTLASVFPGLRGGPAGEVTIHQLLTHTSGMEEVISDHLDRRITARDLETARVSGSGSFEYASTGYVCLALVIEAVTSLPYEAVLERNILIPAGMDQSGVIRSGRSIAGLAVGYAIEDDRFEPADLDYVIEVVDGAGSMYSTVRDLRRFDQALGADKLISRQMRGLMETQHVKGRFGYGWFLKEQGGHYFPWHVGGFAGYASALVRQTHRDEVIVILANLEETDVLRLRNQVLRLLKE